nr:MAG: capsid protein [Cressdnaviricota sp.]
MYGKRKFYKGYTGSSSGYRSGSNTNSTSYKMARKKYRSSKVKKRLSRQETKYSDHYRRTGIWNKNVVGGTAQSDGTYDGQNVMPSFVEFALDGAKALSEGSDAWVQQNSSTVKSYLPIYQLRGNCVTGVGSGTTAKTRIGNVIAPKYLSVNGALVAASVQPKVGGQYHQDGEAVDTWTESKDAGTTITWVKRFVRTTIRVLVVRDKFMNEKGYVDYDDVFQGSEANEPQYLWNRKIDTIGRYEILKDKVYNLDADDPQKPIKMLIPLKGKWIRYNGAATPIIETTEQSRGMNDAQGGTFTTGSTNVRIMTSTASQSMTNGVYILMSAITMMGGNYNATNWNWQAPEMLITTRLSFVDN